MGLGLLGGLGRVLERYTRMAISTLEHFSKYDAHANQYCLISKSLLSTALEYLERKEEQDRQKRTESSSQLFGLVPRNGDTASNPFHTGTASPQATSGNGETMTWQPIPIHEMFSFDSTPGGIDSGMFSFSEALSHTPDLIGGMFDADDDARLGAMNLFPLLDADGHIDLAHYF